MNQKKWIFTALALSLVINIFLAGTLIGQKARKPEVHFREPPIDFNIKKFGEHLTQEERKKVRSLLKSQRSALSAGYKDLRDTEQKIKDLIIAETVNRGALEEALREHGLHVQKLHTPLQDVLLEMVVGMDLEARQKLGEDMFKSRHKKSSKEGARKEHHDRKDHHASECPPPPPERD